MLYFVFTCYFVCLLVECSLTDGTTGSSNTRLMVKNKFFSAFKNNQTDLSKLTTDDLEMLDFMKNDLTKKITQLQEEMKKSRRKKYKVSDVVFTTVYPTAVWTLKPSAGVADSTTTPSYPTATWDLQRYEERLMELRDSIVYSRSTTPTPGSIDEDFDNFLHQTLLMYINSTDFHDSLGNVDVETFAQVLRNITSSAKFRKSPYDLNKELRAKFRDEIIHKKRHETRIHNSLLEKQLLRRIEKMKNSKEFKNKLKKYVETSTEGTVVTTTPVTTEVYKNVTTNSNNHNNFTSPSTTSTEQVPTLSEVETMSVPINVTKAMFRMLRKPDRDDVKLSAQETSYHHQPVMSFVIDKANIGGVIPGTPFRDYPMYSYPPPTGFKCPDLRGRRPTLIADVKSRCQVFYICTGDGPAAAMLCPNGTMFNEAYLVCDWWYNVDCFV